MLPPLPSKMLAANKNSLLLFYYYLLLLYYNKVALLLLTSQMETLRHKTIKLIVHLIVSHS